MVLALLAVFLPACTNLTVAVYLCDGQMVSQWLTDYLLGYALLAESKGLAAVSPGSRLLAGWQVLTK
jgi:hypothetical protein